MGDKGAKQQPQALAVAAELVADLMPLGEVTSKRMFGGVGIFHESAMFALVDSSGTPFLKAEPGVGRAARGRRRPAPRPHALLRDHAGRA